MHMRLFLSNWTKGSFRKGFLEKRDKGKLKKEEDKHTLQDSSANDTHNLPAGCSGDFSVYQKPLLDVSQFIQ